MVGKRQSLLLLILLLVGCNRVDNQMRHYNKVGQVESGCEPDYSYECKTEDYISYVNDDGVFKLTLYIEEGPYFHNEHINIFSTLEYIGNEDTIKIWHGLPFFNYKIFDGEYYFSEGMVATILTSTILEKGETYIFPFKKSGGWSSDDPNADFWENYYKDKKLKLPRGEYLLSAYSDFGLTDNNFSYVNKIEIKFEVK